jgi:S-adenosylmethionine:tRNA ribosyltransferase-isomerase
MTVAHLPIQRPRQARLLVVNNRGNLRHWPRSKFVDLLDCGDLVIANDAATLPASLSGQHVRSGRPSEVRLATQRSLAPDGIRQVRAVFSEPATFACAPRIGHCRPCWKLVIGSR